MLICNSNYILSSYIDKTAFVFISGILLGLLFYVCLTEFKKSKLVLYGGVCALVGGIFNLGERIMFGCVYDYIKFFNAFYFNVSDALIILGIILIICGIMRK